MAVIGSAVNKDGCTVVVVLSQATFGLRYKAWLATLELIDVHSATRYFIQSTLNGFATLVDFPCSAMRFSHDAAEAFGSLCRPCCRTELEMTLVSHLQYLLKCAVAKVSMPVE